jgi:streptogramin lyase
MYPHSIGLAADGKVWFNGHFTKDPELVGYLDAAGQVKNFEAPRHPTMAQVAGGPIPYELRIAPDGRIWFSELQGNRLLALTPATGEFRSYDMPTSFSGPRRFDFDRQGVLWIPAYSANALVRLDPATGRFDQFPLPVRDAVPYVARVDQETGTVWIGASAGDAMFRFDPATRRFTTYPLPSAGALVRHLAIDPRTHDVWIAYGASPGIPARIARLRVRS